MRKNLTNSLLCCLVILSVSTSAFSYGGEGHRAVGLLAQERLNQRAKDAINIILNGDEQQCKDLACVATWPDDLKLAVRNGIGPLANSKEAFAFQKSFPDNDKWHFVNLPLKSKEYTDNGPFSKPNDIVHMINTCIAILEGKSTQFTKRQALRFLVHLVGDIHQPLHVGTGFYTLKGTTVTLIDDPAQVKSTTQSDIGGNDLFFTKNDELHAFWDTCLIQHLTGNATCTSEKEMQTKQEFKKLVPELNKLVPNDQAFLTPGDRHTWAGQWATASVHEAKEAFAPVIFGPATVNPQNGKKFISISIKLPDTYVNDELVRARTQIAKAGAHLAQLLNSIDWK
jgi:hypothetical protein